MGRVALGGIGKHAEDAGLVVGRVRGRVLLVERPQPGMRDDRAEAIGVPWLAAGNIGWLFFKLFMVVSSFLWFRATFPRSRSDQTCRLGGQVVIPEPVVWLGVPGARAQSVCT